MIVLLALVVLLLVGAALLLAGALARNRWILLPGAVTSLVAVALILGVRSVCGARGGCTF